MKGMPTRPPLQTTMLVIGIVIASAGCYSGGEEIPLPLGSGGQLSREVEVMASGGQAPASGGQAQTEQNNPNQGSGGTGPRLDLGDSYVECEFPPQKQCPNLDNQFHCSCDPEAPKGPEDCEANAHFRCRGPEELTGAESRGELENPHEFWGCSCDPQSPLSAADCETPAHFKCAILDSLTGCFCNEEAPAGLDDCEVSQRYRCQQYSPVPIGCDCYGNIEEECNSAHISLRCSMKELSDSGLELRYGCNCYNAGR